MDRPAARRSACEPHSVARQAQSSDWKPADLHVPISLAIWAWHSRRQAGPTTQQRLRTKHFGPFTWPTDRCCSARSRRRGPGRHTKSTPHRRRRPPIRAARSGCAMGYRPGAAKHGHFAGCVKASFVGCQRPRPACPAQPLRAGPSSRPNRAGLPGQRTGGTSRGTWRPA